MPFDLTETAARVEEKVLDRGKLTKNEVLLLFNIPPDRYNDLRKKVLSKYPRRIKSGPKRSGGFVAKYKRQGRPSGARDIPEANFQLANWERAAIARLTDLLDHKILEDLLGDLLYVLRRLREIETGEDRRGTKVELANALLVAHGRDLLADTEIRRAVARALGVRYPGRWHPGKEGAIEFTEERGFPKELGGILAPERQPDFERLEGRVVLNPLEPFQNELREKILQRLMGVDRCAVIATLPTGAGKTRLAVEGLRDYWIAKPESWSVVWLAHTDELCEQAFQCIKEVWEASPNVPPLTAIRYWGRYTRDVETHAVATQSLLSERALVISTPVRLHNALDAEDGPSSGLGRALLAHARVIVIDEAHRAGASTYRGIAGKFQEVIPNVSFVGLTATPFSHEYVQESAGVTELRRTFSELLESEQLGARPRATLQNMRVLAELEIREVSTDTNVSFPDAAPVAMENLSVEEEERVDNYLKAVADLPKRRFAILPYIIDILRNDPQASILYFGPSVHDAQAMTFLLRTRGVQTAFVGAETRTATRRQIISEFKRGDLKVLCNCEVLTTGFDAPKVSYIVMARPTVSRVLWEQMIGRGLRGEKFGGTSRCVVYDFVDNFSGDAEKITGFLGFRRAWREDMRQ